MQMDPQLVVGLAKASPTYELFFDRVLGEIDEKITANNWNCSDESSPKNRLPNFVATESDNVAKIDKEES